MSLTRMKPIRLDARTAHRLPAAGFSMLEVMIALMIFSIGMLGLAGIMARAHNAEIESYSKSEAVLLVNEMAERIEVNLANAKLGLAPDAGTTPGYNTTTVFGTGNPDLDCTDPTAVPSVAARDLCEWDLMLKGAAEEKSGAKLGRLKGARGCIRYVAATREYKISVAWAGQEGFSAPPADLTCGASAIAAQFRRVVARTVRMADLDTVS